MKDDFLIQFPWLERSVSQLSGYINQKRVPQALLITGKKGMGKQALATFFSQSLLCATPLPDETFCGNCQSCTLFTAETHPDYFLIEPEEAGKEIGIAVIRQLVSKLALKPQLEKHRVVIIHLADNLNRNASNAFLKYLEEPTERTCLILISEKPAKLLATIRSRCQKVVLISPDKQVATHWCKQQGIVENNELLLSLAQDAPLQVKQFAESDLLKLRTESFSQWLKMAQTNANFVSQAEQWSKLDKESIDLLLFWMISWVSDMVKLAYCEQASIYNPDIVKDLQEIVVKLNLKDLYKHYDFLLLSRQRLDTQLNKQLLIEETLMQWLKLNGR